MEGGCVCVAPAINIAYIRIIRIHVKPSTMVPFAGMTGKLHVAAANPDGSY